MQKINFRRINLLHTQNVLSLFLKLYHSIQDWRNCRIKTEKIHQIFQNHFTQKFFLHCKSCPKSFPPKFAKGDRKYFCWSFSAKGPFAEILGFNESELPWKLYCIHGFGETWVQGLDHLLMSYVETGVLYIEVKQNPELTYFQKSIHRNSLSVSLTP